MNRWYKMRNRGLKQKKSAEFSIKTALILIKVWYNFVVLKLTLKYAKNTVQNVEIKKWNSMVKILNELKNIDVKNVIILS